MFSRSSMDCSSVASRCGQPAAAGRSPRAQSSRPAGAGEDRLPVNGHTIGRDNSHHRPAGGALPDAAPHCDPPQGWVENHPVRRGDAAQRSADGRTEDPGHRPGRRRGQAARPADQRPGQARRAVRRSLPADRLRAVQPGERERSQDRGAHPVQEPQPRPAHHDDLAAVEPAGQLRHARAGAAAARPALVHRLGGRDLPVAEPDPRRAPGPGGRLRRGPRLPDGPAADVGAAPRRRRRGDRGRHPRAAPRGHRVRRDPDRRRRPQDRGVPGEAGRPARAARPPGRDVRVDGQLRLQHRGAARRPAHRRRRREQQARHGRQHRPDAHRAERRAGLRLPVQRGARRDRGGRALLARRRDDRLVLRRPHGPLRRRPGVQPLQRALADPHPHPLAPAGEVRARRRRPGRARRSTASCRTA